MKHLFLLAFAITTIGVLAFAQGIPEKLEVNMPNPDGIKTKKIVQPVFASQLVSPAQDFAYVGDCNLLIKFNIDRPVAKALWQSVCDDQMKDLWLNGKHVDSAQWGGNWKVIDALQISPEYFVQGENTMAITYKNTGSIGGLAMDLQLLLDNDRFLVVTADQAVGLTGQAPSGWQQPGFDCSSWTPVAKRPGPPATPWTAADTAKYTSIRTNSDVVTISLLQREKLTADVRFSSKKGFNGGEKFSARLTHSNGDVLGEIKGTATELNGIVNDDGTIDIHFSCYNGVYFGSPVKMYWEFGVDSGKMLGDAKVTFTTDGDATPGAPLVSKIENTSHGPIPTVNGNPYFFNILTLHEYGSGLGIRSGMEGEGSPFNTIALRLGSGETIWWTGPNQYDFTAVDRCFNTVFNLYPGCKLAPYVWGQPPSKWYIAKYPERLSRFEEKIDGKDYYQYYIAPSSFSNADALQDSENAVRALVEHIETYFGSRTLLYNLQGGVSCEWQGWAAQSNTYADFSAAAIADFVKYAKKEGINTDHIPGRATREAGSADDKAFHLPKDFALEILYDKYYSETISHFVNSLAKVVKETCPNKLVGAYYGYHMEHANMVHCVNGGGHNDLQTLLDSPYLDFFVSPQSYIIRSYGAPNADMKPYGAIRKAGKLSLIEDDTRTHLTYVTDYEQTPNLEMTLNILKRNVGMSLSRNVPLNHFPIKGGNELDHPAIREMFTKSVKAGQYLLEHGSDPTAEIAAVIDEDSIRYLATRRQDKKVEENERFQYDGNGELKASTRTLYPIIGDLISYQRIPLSQIGAPVDMIMLSDVVKHGKDYKVVIFLNAFKDTPELRAAIQFLRDNNITTVFTYGTGFIDDNGISTKTLSECVGMEMASAGAENLRVKFNNGTVAGMNYGTTTRFKVVDSKATALAKYNNSSSAVAVAKKGNTYFYGTTSLDHDFLQDVARSAGVFFFSDTKDNVFASKDIVSIHTVAGGHKTIHLPKVADVVEIYSGEVIARQADTFEFDMGPFETRVFLYGNLEEIQQALK